MNPDKTLRRPLTEDVSFPSVLVEELCVNVCLLQVFGITAVLDELKHTDIPQMFGATSDHLNQVYTNISVFFFS